MAASPSLWQRIRSALAVIRLTGGVKVSAVEPGKDDDGITRALRPLGTDIDRPIIERTEDIADALEAWRKNPLAKRIVGLVTAYVVGDGINVESKYAPLQRFIDEFWQHSRNRIKLRQAEWCDELTRSGELFLVLFTNPLSGMSQIRAIPASRIDEIRWQPGDYEMELEYHEVGDVEDSRGTWWKSFDHPDAADPTVPIMLHFAINRPVGALRGEGDLNPILPWLKRYTRWLEDRVRLNAGMRSFLWIVYAPRRILNDLTARYRQPPEPGSVIIAEEGAERWEAVTPNLGANDAQHDGRALRWQIAAGGPGTGLTDFGEAFDANQATATVMVDIRRRFLKRRQAYFAWMLVELTLRAYERARGVRNLNRRAVSHLDFIVDSPEISGEDSLTLAAAARDVTIALTNLQELVGDSTELREVSLRLFAKMTEEEIARPLAEKIIASGEQDRSRKQRLEEEKVRSEIDRNRTPRPAAPAARHLRPRTTTHEGGIHAYTNGAARHEPDL